MDTVSLADVAAALADSSEDPRPADVREYAARLAAQFYGPSETERENARGW